jgi:predicted nucleic acid-binding protein
MSEVKKIIAVLDANVLYPAPLRDFLLRMAEADLFFPKWSDEIQDEWIRNLLKKRPDLKAVQLEKTRQAMDNAFEEANVKGFKNLITELHLPDKDDRHVLAVAIKSKASIIVTFNKKDFPLKSVKPHSIEVRDPDEFIVSFLKSNLSGVLESFSQLVIALKKPPQTKDQVLITLGNCGLTESVTKIRKALLQKPG